MSGPTEQSAPFRVGLVAMRSGRRPQENLAAATKLIEEANALARHLRGLHDALNEGSSR